MSGRYKAYGEYKDSGVEWVGSMPSHWTIEPLFSNCDAPIEKNSDGREKNVLSLSYGNIIPRDVDDNFGLLPESFNTYQLVYPQNIILRLTDLQNDKRSLRVGFSKQQGIITSAYLKLVFTKKMSSPFMYRLLHSYDTTKVFYGMGGGLRQSMKFEDFRRLPLLIPSFAEQTQIAAFLDHETAKIDTLIDKQQQLIELLKEKRQAVISHAVTKGLNPDVPMKDSGVEWLGEVPQTWEMWKLAHAFEVIGSGTTPSSDNDSWFEGDIPWVTTGELRETVITHTIKKVSKLTLERFSALKIHPVGSVVIAMYGATIGRLGILGVKSTTNQACCVLTFSRVIDNKYLYYWLGGYKDDIIRLSSGGGQPNINQEKVASLKISSPILKEQTQIATFLDYETAKIDKLIDLQLLQIELLKERRTALISAAVTGKIDVRDWQVPVTQTESDEVMA